MADPFARPMAVVEQDIRNVMAERAKVSGQIESSLTNLDALRRLYAAQGNRIEELFSELDRADPQPRATYDEIRSDSVDLIRTPEREPKREWIPVPPERQCVCPVDSPAQHWTTGTQCPVHGGYYNPKCCCGDDPPSQPCPVHTDQEI